MQSVIEIAKLVKEKGTQLGTISTQKKDEILVKISEALIKNTNEIIKQNAVDIENAKENNIPPSIIDRLLLTKERIEDISNAVLKLTQLSDPCGVIDGGKILPNGLRIEKWRVPLGVIGIIYEARPNVTVDAATLCLKSGNSCILRGGKEAINSNKILIKIMQDVLIECGLNAENISFIEDTDRKSATEMMKLNGYIDVLIPRGGRNLIKSVTQNATVPVIETGTGNCHVYVDESADFDMAINIIDNAKTQRTGVCNAIENMLINEKIAKDILPLIKKRLDLHNVEIRGCEKSLEILPDIKLATEEDYETEFLDYIIALKIVPSVKEAVEHIKKYTSGHSECIVSNNYESICYFTKNVDAAAVYVNASTRFTDGGEFGLGAEIGISTQKLHARGPMGLMELTTIKYAIFGNGQIR